MAEQRYALINDVGLVINVTSWDATANPSWTPPAGETAVQSDVANVGGTLIGGVYTPPVPPTPPTPTPAQAAQIALNGGINLISTGTPALNGTYSASLSSITNVANVQTYCLSNPGFFPGGGTTMPWMDTSNNHHTFPDTATFKNFATAFADWVAAVQLWGDSNGTQGGIPSNTLTIP